MHRQKFPDPGGNGGYTVTRIADFEYVNPIQKLGEMHVRFSMSFERDFLKMSGFQFPVAMLERILLRRAIKSWEDDYARLLHLNVPPALFDLLQARSKKEQIKLLKGMALDGDQLMCFIFQAWLRDGYTYSMYTSEHVPNGTEASEMPPFALKEEDRTITSIGPTTLSPGQIRQAIDHRSVIVSKFLDKGDFWHCFFLTFKSLKGEETYKNGQPHLHYISDKWGLTREYVLAQLKSKDYKLPALPHIDYTDRDRQK